MLSFKKYCLLTSAALMLAFGTSAIAATAQFYVSPTGDDNTGDGSISQPWQTVQKAMFTIPFSMDDVDVNLREGTYVLPATIFIDVARGGSEAGTFRIRSYNDETAILDGSLIPEFGAMISINNTSHVAIEDLEITNLIGNKTGIYVTGSSSHITLARNEIHNMHWTTNAAAKLAPLPSDNLNPVVILGNAVDPMRAITIIENDVYNLTTGYSEAIKIVGNVDGFLVQGNDVFDVSNICIVAAGNYPWVGLTDPELNHARNGIIRYNTTYRCVSPIAASAGIYVDGGRDILVSHNYSYLNTVGFSVGSEQTGDASGIILSRNTAVRNSQAGLFLGTITPTAEVKNVIVTENKFKNNYTDPVYGGAPIVMSNASSVTVDDNLLVSNSQYMMTLNGVVTNLQIDRNEYRSSLIDENAAVFVWAGTSGVNYFSFDEYKSATGLDKSSTFN